MSSLSRIIYYFFHLVLLIPSLANKGNPWWSLQEQAGFLDISPLSGLNPLTSPWTADQAVVLLVALDGLVCLGRAHWSQCVALLTSLLFPAATNTAKKTIKKKKPFGTFSPSGCYFSGQSVLFSELLEGSHVVFRRWMSVKQRDGALAKR